MIVGLVVNVWDGDTITVKSEIGKHKVRLAQIDSTELSFFGHAAQPFSSEAKNYLTSLIYNKIVSVNVESIDGYQRNVGTVFDASGLNVNREMVRVGLAFVYHEYVTDDVLIEFEKDAKAKRIGIWSVDDVKNPHYFRIGK
jgi:micrococcal nuclease